MKTYSHGWVLGRPEDLMIGVGGKYKRSYVQGSKGDTDVKNGLVDSVGEGEAGMI